MKEWVKFTQLLIFHDFDTLANIEENGCTRKKPWYTVLYKASDTKTVGQKNLINSNVEGIWHKNSRFLPAASSEATFAIDFWRSPRVSGLYKDICLSSCWRTEQENISRVYFIHVFLIIQSISVSGSYRHMK